MNVANPHFAEPAWLWLAFLAPLVLFGLQRYAARARRRDLEKLAAPGFVKEITVSHSAVRRELKNILLLIGVAGMGLALARPQWGEQVEKSHVFGHDLVFVLDCSRSMLTSDVTPSRLQRAKLAILDYVQREAHGRLGLVAFAGQAFLQCPLTFDYGAFHDALSLVDERTIPVPGTDIGRALEEGFQSMDKKDRQKVLVLLTDGEDLEKGGIRTAESLAKKGLVVFTLGVGTPTGGDIQYLTEQGRVDTVRDRQGQVVQSRLDEATLRSIAEATHGAYYRLGPVGEGLARVRLALENLKSTTGATPTRKLGIDRFYLPTAIVLALLVLESLIGTRRRVNESTAAEQPSVKAMWETK